MRQHLRGAKRKNTSEDLLGCVGRLWRAAKGQRLNCYSFRNIAAPPRRAATVESSANLDVDINLNDR